MKSDHNFSLAKTYVIFYRYKLELHAADMVKNITGKNERNKWELDIFLLWMDKELCIEHAKVADVEVKKSNAREISEIT